VTAIPAAGGRKMAKEPARIIKTLRAINHPTALLITVEEEIDVAPMPTPPKILLGI
jgi:hypothetical protein